MFYESFADSYDDMIDWRSRLQSELEHFLQLFAERGVKRILDVACGTAMHAIAFAREGYKVVGVDASDAMLEQAFENVHKAKVKGISLKLGEFGQLRKVVRGHYDTVLCLGNSLPHVLDDEQVIESLREFWELLRPGGFLILQMVHFDHYLDSADSAVAVTDGERNGRPATFRRHYEFKGTKVIFHVSVYDRGTRQLLETYNSPLNPIRCELLETFMEKVSFEDIRFYADMSGEPLTTEAKSMICMAVRPRN